MDNNDVVVVYGLFECNEGLMRYFPWSDFGVEFWELLEKVLKSA